MSLLKKFHFLGTDVKWWTIDSIERSNIATKFYQKCWSPSLFRIWQPDLKKVVYEDEPSIFSLFSSGIVRNTWWRCILIEATSSSPPWRQPLFYGGNLPRSHPPSFLQDISRTVFMAATYSFQHGGTLSRFVQATFLILNSHELKII